MISYPFLITNRSGDSIEFNDHSDPANVFALQAFPKFSRNIKNTEIERQGQNNYWDFYSYNGRMTVTFQGIITAESHQKLEQMRAQMLKVFSIPFQSTALQDGYVTISWTDDDGIAKQVEAKLIQDINFDRRLSRRTVMDFQIQVKTKQNFISSLGGYAGTVTGKRGYKGEGFIIPTLLPFSTTSDYYEKLSITTLGNGALPTITLYGEDQQPITNPSILNITTGVLFKVSTILNSSSEYLTINTEDGTVFNAQGIDLSGYIDITSGFITLAPGLNELVYLADESPFVTGLLPEAGTRVSVSYKTIYAS